MKRLPAGESVVVVTGASSGIGRAAARDLARRGADVVLAARDPATLADAAAECERAGGGGRVIACPTDVTDQDQVHALADRAHAEFGRIDVWVNGAAVIAFGEFEDIPADAYRQVIDTNLFGQINGARAVLPHFRRAERGVLINVGSVWGSVSSPYVSAYVVSKFGVRAFSESLQEALRLDRVTRDVHVCTILPQCVDTPIFQHAATYGVARPRAVPPVVAPQRVVHAIVASIEHPRRVRTVAGFARVLEFGHAVLPGLYSRTVPTAMKLLAFGGQPAEDGPGNLFEPVPEHNRIDGQWRRTGARRGLGAAAATASAAVAAGVIRRRRRTG